MPSSPNYVRDLKEEYRNYGSKPSVKKKRALNNKARRKMIREGKARIGDGKDVAHLDNNVKHSNLGNLAVQSKHKNRSFKRDKHAGRA
jgi:hypothetical protein